MTDQLSAKDWLDQGLKALAHSGFTALKAEPLAKAMGVSRGSFYWHFSDMMAYRAAGVDIPRTSEQQFFWGPQVPASQVEPGDLVFFAGGDGTPSSPGHVGLVIGRNEMIEAYATGFPIRVSAFGTPAAAPGDTVPVGFTRPWQHAGVVLAAG